MAEEQLAVPPNKTGMFYKCRSFEKQVQEHGEAEHFSEDGVDHFTL